DDVRQRDRLLGALRAVAPLVGFGRARVFARARSRARARPRMGARARQQDQEEEAPHERIIVAPCASPPPRCPARAGCSRACPTTSWSRSCPPIRRRATARTR